MMKSIIKIFLLSVALCGVANVQAKSKPNLLVIMCDDLGYADVSFNVQDGVEAAIPTPNIDSIAKSGAKCTSAYVTYPACGPSRAGFMAGRYQDRFGFCGNPTYDIHDETVGFSLEEKTLAEALRPVGYYNGIIGKWHLGAVKDKLHPLARGFDEFYGHLNGGHRYFPKDLKIKDPYSAPTSAEAYKTWLLHNHKAVLPSKYLTDEFTDQAISFVTRNKEKPFFLFLSYNAPHAPLQAPQEYIDRFSHVKDKDRRVYSAMVSNVDDNVGRLLNTLSEKNLDENTLIFFLSDNGGKVKKKPTANNGPLRGGKSNPWEGGIRVPFAVQWKGVIPPNTIYDKPVSSLDIFGTIAELSGAPENRGRPLDGVNIIPFLTGQNKGIPHEQLFMRKHAYGSYTIRRGDYKLVIDKQSKPELYNVTDDISETKILNDQMPERVHELNGIIKTWNSGLKEPVFEGEGNASAKALMQKVKGKNRRPN
ncbi:MAG: sulfatase-like hydrolase/transferase [Planctomycetes bacterium]|nr:sulfatase-like hydrolase/transferase [Planctomycetota bacterium]